MDLKKLNVPEKIALIMDQLSIIKELLEKKLHSERVEKTLNFKDTIRFMSQKGYGISSSKLYKLTSTDSIPFKRFGNKLVFDSDELLKWCESKTATPKFETNAITNLIAMANKKSNHHGR